MIYFCLANNPKTLRLETIKPKKNKLNIMLGSNFHEEEKAGKWMFVDMLLTVNTFS